MDLILRVGGIGVPETPVAISIDGTASGSRIIEVLAEHFGVGGHLISGRWIRTGGRLEHVEDFSDLQPRDGDQINLVSLGPKPPEPRADEAAPPPFSQEAAVGKWFVGPGVGVSKPGVGRPPVGPGVGVSKPGVGRPPVGPGVGLA